MRRLFVPALWALLVLSAACAHAAEDLGMPPGDSAAPTATPGREEPATLVHMGVYVMDLRSLDMRSQSFRADFYLWLRFATTDEEQARLIEERLEIVNGTVDSKELVDQKQVGEETYLCYRVVGTFHFNPTLYRYPFDVQSLELVFDNAALDSESVRFVDDIESYRRGSAPSHLWSVKPGLDLPEFRLLRVERRGQDELFPTNFGDPSRPQGELSYATFIVRMEFQREYLSYVIKVVIPLLVILAMAYVALFLPAKEVNTSTAIAITALLSAIAFNIAVSQNMPEVGYLVVSDKFFIASYLLLLAMIGERVAIYVLDDSSRADTAIKVARCSRRAFPVAVAAMFVYLLIGGLV